MFQICRTSNARGSPGHAARQGLENNKKERLFWDCAHNHPAILRHMRSLFPAIFGLDGSFSLTRRNGSEWAEMTRHDLVHCRDSVVAPPGPSPFAARRY